MSGQWKRILVAVVAAGGVVGPQTLAADLSSDLARLAAAAPGTGHAPLAAAADTLAAIPPAGIRPALAALTNATPAGANWLRSGLDRAVERLGSEVSADTLAGFVTDPALPPRARSLAFGWLEARDGARAEDLLDGMLDESALDLRRAAVAKLLAPSIADEAVRREAHRRALTAARDVDQVEAIATWLTEHGEPVDVADVLGFIRRWRVSGEYDNVGGVGFATAYPPESADAAGSDPADWKGVESADRHGAVDLNAMIATKKGVLAYAQATVTMPEAGLAEVRVGSPCAVVVWVNGRQVMAHEIYHASEAIDHYVAPAEFRAGENTVLVKCCQNEQTDPWAGDWKFQVRITDPLGLPLARQGAVEDSR